MNSLDDYSFLGQTETGGHIFELSSESWTVRENSDGHCPKSGNVCLIKTPAFLRTAKSKVVADSTGGRDILRESALKGANLVPFAGSTSEVRRPMPSVLQLPLMGASDSGLLCRLPVGHLQSLRATQRLNEASVEYSADPGSRADTTVH